MENFKNEAKSENLLSVPCQENEEFLPSTSSISLSDIDDDCEEESMSGLHTPSFREVESPFLYSEDVSLNSSFKNLKSTSAAVFDQNQISLIDHVNSGDFALKFQSTLFDSENSISFELDFDDELREENHYEIFLS
jgi:hypothetical protein